MNFMPEYEVVEMDGAPIAVLTDIRQQGFKASRCGYYHPQHWKVEDATEAHRQMGATEVMIVGDEAFLPITEDARVWLQGILDSS